MDRRLASIAVGLAVLVSLPVTRALAAAGTTAGPVVVGADQVTGTSSTTDVTQPLVLGDLRGNGVLDAVAVNNNFGNTFPSDVTESFGDGHGNFGAPTTYQVGAQPDQVAVCDVDGDGHPDIVVDWGSGSGVSIAVLLGTGTETSVSAYAGDGAGHCAPNTVSYDVGEAYGVFAVDLNHDGKLDILTVDRMLSTAQSPGIEVLLGNGDGTFQAPIGFALPAEPFGFVLTDLNGDGNTDVVVSSASGNGLTAALGDGHGGFAVGPEQGDPCASAGVERMAAGNFAQSGHPEIAAVVGTTSLTQQSPTTYHVVVLAYAPSSTPLASTPFTGAQCNGPTVTQGSSLTATDVNSDGLLDLVDQDNGNSGSVTHVLVNSGAAAFTDRSFSDDPGNYGTPVVFAVTDLNGDGNPDIIGATDSAIITYSGNGDGTFGHERHYVISAYDSSSVVAPLVRGGPPVLLNLYWSGKPGLQGEIAVATLNGAAPVAVPEMPLPGMALALTAIAAGVLVTRRRRKRTRLSNQSD